MKASLISAQAGKSKSESEREIIMEDEQGYSGWFYFALIAGIVGIVGFLVVAGGAGGM